MPYPVIRHSQGEVPWQPLPPALPVMTTFPEQAAKDHLRRHPLSVSVCRDHRVKFLLTDLIGLAVLDQESQDPEVRRAARHANELTGPWNVHPPGSLQLAESHFPTEAPDAPPEAVERIRTAARRSGLELPHDIAHDLTTPHIASPDVHVDDANRRIAMYFHGLEGFARQVARVATSTDGLHFESRPEIL